MVHVAASLFAFVYSCKRIFTKTFRGIVGEAGSAHPTRPLPVLALCNCIISCHLAQADRSQFYSDAPIYIILNKPMSFDGSSKYDERSLSMAGLPMPVVYKVTASKLSGESFTFTLPRGNAVGGIIASDF